MKKILTTTALVATAVLSATPALALPTLQISNGHLMGATGVSVNGGLYNVSFQDGSCPGLFGECKGMVFATAPEAQAASNALLSQVFLDQNISGTHYSFDSNPELTNGCTSATRCWVITPYTSPLDIHGNVIRMNGYAAYNNFGLITDEVKAFSYNPHTHDTSNDPGMTYAVWAPVPEPETYAMLLAGLGVMGPVARRRKIK